MHIHSEKMHLNMRLILFPLTASCSLIFCENCLCPAFQSVLVLMSLALCQHCEAVFTPDCFDCSVRLGYLDLEQKNIQAPLPQ